jgi:hypothetical protein
VRSRAFSVVLLVTAIVAGLLMVVDAFDSSRPIGTIAQENQKPGTTAWRSVHVDSLMAGFKDDYDELEEMLEEARYETPRPGDSADSDRGGPPAPKASGEPTALPVVGYFDRQSVNTGQTVGLHISSTVGAYDLEIYRMGWYGGTGATLVASYPSQAGTARSVPAPNANGTVELTWPVSRTLHTSGWQTGYYMAVMKPAGQNTPQSYAPVVVRNDASASPIVVQIPFTTYQAYNSFGGKSIYEYNSTGGVRGSKVSFDRPYDYFDGAGLFFWGDYHLIRWIEREGYEVSYVASSDTETRPDLMNNHKAFVSAFHDEYWSNGMRQNLDSWIAAGKSAAFLSANNIYWQMRWENSSSGVPQRILVCYKSWWNDPMSGTNPALATITWRDPAINRPEYLTLGAYYDTFYPYGTKRPWVVTNANHWIYNGTGLTNGASIDDLVGYEWDLVPTGYAPPGLTVLSNSPMAGVGDGGTGVRQQATIWEKPNGSIVFNASTTYWPRLLGGDQFWDADQRVERMTKNLLDRMVGTPSGPTPTPPPTTAPPPPPPSSDASAFVALDTQVRLLDTRGGAAPAPGQSVDVRVTGIAGVPASATAVAVNVTAADSTNPGWVQALPKGRAAIGSSSTVNIDTPGQTIANSAIVAVGNDSSISLYTYGGGHLLLDVIGYFAPVSGSTSGGRLESVDPTRLLDTRLSVGLRAAQSTTSLRVAGAAGLPASARAVVLNVTATQAAPGFLQLAPSDRLAPGTTSNVNTTHFDQTIANLVIVPLSATGEVSIYNSASSQVIVDLLGWFTGDSDPSSAEGLFRVLSPARILDTRPGGAAPGKGADVALPVLGLGGVPSAHVSAVVGNLAAVEALAPGYVQLSPPTAAIGSSSSLNVERSGQTVANAAISRVGSQPLRIHLESGAHLLFDVAGWFS